MKHHILSSKLIKVFLIHSYLDYSWGLSKPAQYTLIEQYDLIFDTSLLESCKLKKWKIGVYRFIVKLLSKLFLWTNYFGTESSFTNNSQIKLKKTEANLQFLFIGIFFILSVNRNCVKVSKWFVLLDFLLKNPCDFKAPICLWIIKE